jgi:hypothetical protein
MGDVLTFSIVTNSVRKVGPNTVRANGFSLEIFEEMAARFIALRAR